MLAHTSPYSLVQVMALHMSIAVFLPCAMIAAFVTSQPQHLMMWAVFAPRLVFEVATVAIVGVCCLVGFVAWGWRAASTSFAPRVFADAAHYVRD